MSKHTPGPWDIGETDPNEQVEIVAAGGGLIALVTHECVRGSQEMEANARLIAAAPELLEALKEALDDLLKDGYEHGAPPYEVDKDPVILGVRAAIAKAEGRS